MKVRAFLISGTIALLANVSYAALQVHNPVQRAEVLPPVGPKIKVLLEKDVASAYLEARGPFRVIRKDSGASLSSGSSGKRYVVHALQDGLRWGEEFPDVYQISIVPLSADSYIFVNGIQYKGAVSVYHVRDNRITIVNEVPIEEYLKSTLAIQYDKALPKEAMKALAIAARTQAYSKVLQGETSARPWDIDAREANYYGYGVTLGKNGVEDAVDWTRYMVLESSKQGRPLQNSALDAEVATELAKSGSDVQKILKSSFPKTKIGATIDADEVALR